ncbi:MULTISPECIES: NAD(P)/FAD-dependent oxidoreductase [unclassified Streptomyces]|uniref:phytoene desaturase family protein n=1 Tax=unclassified Streptomyces TaxID=2593676 RepID=UPI000D36D09B|nr:MULTISPECIES: NAD(P)/FAD-dependent oxidoreductase [unclassified Streptomyces]PTM96663.1 phytoene dehydrogenase-like protein [Streptomyces sp. VMFN-G11Ma]
MTTATVVGAGPNGLAAAAALARAGLEVTVLEAADEIGGGTRSVEATVPGLLHDCCSAVHPMAVGSPFLNRLGLDRHGLRWAWPEIDCAHPLDNGGAAVLHRSVTETAAGLGADGALWRRLFEGPTAAFGTVGDDIMGPLLRPPRHPVRLTRFGLPALAPASLLAKTFRTEKARALWGGVAAHAFHPLERPLTASVGLGIVTAGHHYGWPVAVGGSRRITDALAAVAREHGGKIETGVRVRSVAELPRTDVTLWDLTPTALADILGDLLPPRIARAYRRYRYGPGAFKVDFAIEGGIPWRAEAARRAGTVHVGGSYAEVAATERDIHAGRMPQRPFVLVGQQYLADPSRSAGDLHPVWSYAHVPNGYTGDATAAITAQIERFAPGFRDRVVATAVRTTPQFTEYNANYVGGDIMTGATDATRLVFGPRPTLQPYDTGVPGHYLCSAATPPGAGAHGMCGAHAAARALRRLGG